MRMRVLCCFAPRAATIGGGQSVCGLVSSILPMAGDMQRMMDSKPPPTKKEIMTVSSVVVGGK